MAVFFLSLLFFLCGVYLFLQKGHVLRLLLAGELILHASLLNIIAFGHNKAAAASIILYIVGSAIAEGVIILALYVKLRRSYRKNLEKIPLIDLIKL